MSGRTSRAKGARFERELAGELRGMGFNAKRCLQFRGDADGPDVLIELPNLLRILIEAKRHKRVRLRAALEQMEAYPRLPGDMRMACCRDDRNEAIWLVPHGDMMPLLAAFLEIMEKKCSENSD